MLAPIIIFAFNRPGFLGQVVEGLHANPDAAQSNLYIFCDGARAFADEGKVAAVRQVARAVTGFREVTVVERPVNFGLSRSIMEGVGEVCARHGRAIILEDDVVPNRHFLAYVNAALDKYEDDDRVSSVGCYTFDGGADLPDTFFLRVPDCVGWGVWNRSWSAFNADGKKLLSTIVEGRKEREFDFNGSYAYVQMLRDQVRGKNQSWAVRWYAHVFLTGGLVLYPRWAVTQNIGLSDTSGTHGPAIDNYALARLSDQPISVGDIPLEESEQGRTAWIAAFRKIQAGPIRRLVYAIRSSLGLGSSLRRVRRAIMSRPPQKIG